MRIASTLIAATLFLSCGSDFMGDNRVYAFDSTLSRPTVAWTPATPVALGESFSVRKGFSCIFDCPAPFTAASMSPPNGVLIGDPLRDVTASSVGATSIVTNAAADRFSVTVVEAAGLRLTDPLELSRPRWAHLRNADGGPAPFPDVGEEIVMGADAGLYLDVILTDDAGAMVASRSGFSVTSVGANGTSAVSAALDGRMIDLQSGPVGDLAHATVSRLDGGFAQTWNVRVAGPEEIAAIELVQISVDPDAIVRAIVRRADGGVFLEPPITWTTEGVAEQDYTKYRADLRVRSDLKMYRAVYDAGLPRATVSGGGVMTSITLDVPEASPPDEPAPPPPMMMRQGCSTSPTMFVLGAMLLLAGSRLSVTRRNRG